ncbi:unnamed protein product [Rotaria sp. Silwood1]|nr:unnamed protein product [Rotaria sp. Silwood1]CAF1588431.1 unnamed protein product [Rotaria sp. Silwood1]CAF4754949.1 unnamed protein product [Rotaria sp. Silwood1]
MIFRPMERWGGMGCNCPILRGALIGVIDFIEDADKSAANIYEILKATIKKAGLHLEGLTSIGADNTNVNMGNNYNVYSLLHDIENLIKDKNHWPPNSPDLNPLNYCIWDEFAQCVSWEKVTSKPTLVDELKRAVKKIRQDVVLQSCSSWTVRLRCVLENDGHCLKK